MLSFLKFAVSTYNPRLFISDGCSNTSYDEHFNTDSAINGKYFKSKSENVYYQIIKKNSTPNIHNLYKKSHIVEQMTNNFDKDNFVIVQLQMRDDCKYFIENDNNIGCFDKEQDFISLTYVKNVDDFYNKTPPFIPLPNDHPIGSPEYSDNKEREKKYDDLYFIK